VNSNHLLLKYVYQPVGGCISISLSERKVRRTISKPWNHKSRCFQTNLCLGKRDVNLGAHDGTAPFLVVAFPLGLGRSRAEHRRYVWRGQGSYRKRFPQRVASHRDRHSIVPTLFRRFDWRGPKENGSPDWPYRKRSSQKKRDNAGFGPAWWDSSNWQLSSSAKWQKSVFDLTGEKLTPSGL